jgi:hypothetical protein
MLKVIPLRPVLTLTYLLFLVLHSGLVLSSSSRIKTWTVPTLLDPKFPLSTTPPSIKDTVQIDNQTQPHLTSSPDPRPALLSTNHPATTLPSSAEARTLSAKPPSANAPSTTSVSAPLNPSPLSPNRSRQTPSSPHRSRVQTAEDARGSRQRRVETERTAQEGR